MKLSRFSFWVCAALLVYVGAVFYPRWKQSGGEAQLSWDAAGYYWYLPSAFVYKDLKNQRFKDSVLQKYQPTPPSDFQYAYKDATTGNYVIRYTLGTALLEAPFFFIAHQIAKPLGYPDDGFSLPYQVMIYLGGILFSLLGLWYLRKLLLFYYTDTTVAITLFLLVFGTNYLNYAGIDVGMTHSWLFTIYVFILLNTHYLYKDFKTKYALRVGLLVGLAGLIRPPEVISVIIPILWGLEFSNLIKTIKERIQLFALKWKSIVPAIILCTIILSLQFFYWKYATGKWFVYSYRDQGFSWFAPRFKQYALNFQCGWLWYTPLMFFIIPALFLFAKKGVNRLAIISLILINFYIVSAWNAWDYGGRAMIQNYPVLLFPLAALIEFIRRKKVLLILAAPLLLLCTYFNLWWTYQAHHGTLIGGTPATAAYYWATAMRFTASPEIQKLRDNEDLYQGSIKNPVTFYSNNLDSVENGHFIVVNDKQQSLHFNLSGKKTDWLRASADIRIENKEWNVWFMTQFIVRVKRGNETVKENSIRLQRFLEQGKSQNITIDVDTRGLDFDNIEILFRNDNNGSQPCYVDNVKVIGFDD